MKVLDLFCGVGGLSLGLESAGFETVLGVEKDEDIASGFELNFPNSKCLVTDISQICTNSYIDHLKSKKIDLIAGGPPCQGFSQKGKRLKLEDERNFLFNYFLDIVIKLKPKAFLIENVPNILSTSNGFFYQEILSRLKSKNYSISSSVLNAIDFGIPQNRRRAFIIGVLDSKPFEFPNPISKKISVAQAINDLPVLKSGRGENFINYTKRPKSEYQKSLRIGSSGIYNHVATNHSAIALQRLELIPVNGGKENLPEEHLTKSIYSGTWKRLRSNEQAPTITTRFDTPSSGQFTLPRQNRCLTVREAARLQSFPDRFIFTGTKSNQMIQVGNAVPPLLAESIGKALIEKLKKLRTEKSQLVAA